MKTILVLVNPEHPVNNIAESCILLSAKLSANITLLSTYLLLPITDFYAGAPWIDQGVTLWEQDTKYKLNKLSIYLQTIIKGLASNIHNPTVQTHISEGNLGTSVKIFIQNNEVELVVMVERQNLQNLQKFNYPHLSYSMVSSRDVVKRLLSYSKNNNSNILAMMHHQHHFFGRLIKKSVTKIVISDQNIPLLVLSSKL